VPSEPEAPKTAVESAAETEPSAVEGTAAQAMAPPEPEAAVIASVFKLSPAGSTNPASLTRPAPKASETKDD
jgi:hypothetical protein